MLSKLIDDATRAVEERAKSLGANALVALVVVALAVVSLFFLTVAAFVWAETEYGTITASLGLGLLFAAVAAAIALVARIRARRVETIPRPSRPYLLEADAARSPETNPEWWIAPVGIATGIEVLRKIGAHRLIPAFALSAVVVAALQSYGAKAKSQAAPK